MAQSFYDFNGPWMVVGLGNPSAQYANTRLSVYIDLLAHNAGVQLELHRSGTYCADIRQNAPRKDPGPAVCRNQLREPSRRTHWAPCKVLEC